MYRLHWLDIPSLHQFLRLSLIVLFLSEGDRRSSEGRVDVGIIQLSNDDKKDDDKEDDDKKDDDKEDDDKED